MNKFVAVIKKIVPLIIVIVGFSFSFQKKSEQITDNKTVSIIGSLSGFDNDIQVVLKYDDLATEKQIQYFAKTENGVFQFKFPKYNLQDAVLMVGKEMIPLLVVPGEEICINLDNANKTEPVQFTGSNNKFNRDFYLLYKALNKLNSSIDSTNIYKKSSSPEEYKFYVYRVENKLNEFITDYINRNAIDNEISEWFRIFIKYKTVNYLTNPYNFTWKKYNVKPDYWTFLNESLVNNEKALCCSEYYKFCTSYFIYLSNIESKFSAAFKFLGNDWKNHYKILIDKLDAAGDGIMTDILISNFSHRFMKDDFQSFGELKTQIIEKIKNPLIKQLISEAYSSLFQMMEKLKSSEKINIYDYRTDETSPDIIKLLTSKYKEKIIYIDNWASWCGPCIAEMPHSVNLQEDYKNKDIVFVFLCMPDNYINDRAVAIIAENQVSGEHYLMSHVQNMSNQVLCKKKSIPRYILINKEGKIIDNDAPRPSSIEIRKKFDELL